MAIIYKFPSGEKIHKFEQDEFVERMATAVDQQPHKAELHFLPGFKGPLIGFSVSPFPTSTAEIPPQLES